MAITHFSIQIISRGDGRSALLSAAYRHCAKMSHESEGRSVDYSNKPNLGHEEFLLPPDAPQWARALMVSFLYTRPGQMMRIGGFCLSITRA